MGVLVLCLVLGGVAIPADDLLQPPGHGLHQGPQVRAVAYPLGPQLLDVALQLRNGGGLAVLQLGLHPQLHQFSMGLRSGLLPGQSISWMAGRLLRSDVKIWHGPI